MASLNGQTIYVVVEDPSSLFDPTAYVTSSGDVYTLHLKGKSLATAGHYVGSLKIYVSLDSAGTAPLGNTPLVVPYDVTVDPGLVLEPDSGHLSRAPGQMTASMGRPTTA